MNGPYQITVINPYDYNSNDCDPKACEKEIRKAKAEVILVDLISMGDRILDKIRQLKSTCTDVPIIGVHTYQDPVNINLLLAAGLSAFTSLIHFVADIRAIISKVLKA